MNHYWSDTHYRHKNIIAYCSRPFHSVSEMDATLAANFRQVEEISSHIYHLGDFSMNIENIDIGSGSTIPLPVPVFPKKNTLIAGNHDRLSGAQDRLPYYTYFGQIIGLKPTWRTNTLCVGDTLGGHPVRLLLSHEPQKNLQGCHYNLYGHHHSNLILKPDQYLVNPRDGTDWHWLYESHIHLNVSVEILGYIPRTLEEIIAMSGGKSIHEYLHPQPATQIPLEAS